MSRNLLIVTGLLAGIIVFSSCQGKEEPLFPPITAAEISGEALWDRITEDYHYSDYSFWPGHEGVRAGQAPQGALHRIYINRTLLEAIPISESVAPDGAIIVKDNLNASRELDSVTVMAKVKGFNPEAGDWFWAMYTPDGTVQVEGKPNGCIRCHEGVRDNDYVIVQRLSEPYR